MGAAILKPMTTTNTHQAINEVAKLFNPQNQRPEITAINTALQTGARWTQLAPAMRKPTPKAAAQWYYDHTTPNERHQTTTRGRPPKTNDHTPQHTTTNSDNPTRVDHRSPVVSRDSVTVSPTTTEPAGEHPK